MGCFKTKGRGEAEDVFQGTSRTAREWERDGGTVGVGEGRRDSERGEVAKIPRRTAWGPVYTVGQVVGGERGLIRQRFYAPAPAPPAVSDAATIMPRLNVQRTISGTITA